MQRRDLVGLLRVLRSPEIAGHYSHLREAVGAAGQRSGPDMDRHAGEALLIGSFPPKMLVS